MQGDKTTGMHLPEARAPLPASPLHTMTGCLAFRPAATELPAPLRRVTHLANSLPLHQPPLPPDIPRYVPPAHTPTRTQHIFKPNTVLLCMQWRRGSFC